MSRNYYLKFTDVYIAIFLLQIIFPFYAQVTIHRISWGLFSIALNFVYLTAEPENYGNVDEENKGSGSQSQFIH